MEPDGGGVSAVPSQIRRHGDTVGQVAERAGQAYGAARQVMLDRRSYGLMCAVMPLALHPLQVKIAAAMRHAVRSLEDTEQALHVAAALIEGADREAELKVGTIPLAGL